MSLKPSARADERQIIPAGQHGLAGEAELVRIVARPIPWEKRERDQGKDPWYYVDFRVQVDTEQGRMFVSTSPINCAMYAEAGGICNATLRALGINPESVEFSEQADENNNHALISEHLSLPAKVVIEVKHTVSKDRTYADIKNLALRE